MRSPSVFCFAVFAAVLLAGVAASASHFDLAKVHELYEMQHSFQKHVDEFVQKMPSGVEISSHPAVSPSASLACLSATSTFQATVQSCGLDSFLSDVYGSSLSNNLNNYCSGPCIANLTTSANLVVSNCRGGGLDVSLSAAVRTYIKAINLPCLKDSAGNLCLPIVAANFKARTGNFYETADATTLNSWCSECTQKFLGALASRNPGFFGSAGVKLGLRSMCLKDQGQFCLLSFRATGSVSSSSIDLSTEAKIGSMCNNRCLYKYISLKFAIDTEVSSSQDSGSQAMVRMGASLALEMFRLVCLKNEAGKSCLLVANQTGSGSDIFVSAGCTIGTSTCAATCKAAINTLNTQLGCCFGSFIDVSDRIMKATTRASLTGGLTGGISAGGTNVNADVSLGVYVRDTCGVQLNRCPGAVVKRIIGKFVVRNLLSSYASAHPNEINAAVAADIAAYSGVDANSVKVTGSASVSASSGPYKIQGIVNPSAVQGTEFSVDIQSTSSVSGDAKNDLVTGVTTNAIVYASLSTYSSDAADQPQQEYSSEPSSSSTFAVYNEDGSPSASAALTPSKMILALVIAAFVALMF